MISQGLVNNKKINRYANFALNVLISIDVRSRLRILLSLKLAYIDHCTKTPEGILYYYYLKFLENRISEYLQCRTRHCGLCGAMIDTHDISHSCQPDLPLIEM